MKALLVYYEPEPSGQTTHVLSLARGLTRRGWLVTVVLPDHLRRSIEPLAQVAHVVPLPLPKLAWPSATATALARLIRDSGFDIVHIHSQEAGLPGRLVARLAGAPRLVYTPQTLDIRRARWHGLYRLIERALARLTDALVSVNEADRQRLIRWHIPPQKIVTIPNGIDLAAFSGPVDRAGLRAELGLDPAGPLVMQVGRLSAQKAPLAFVRGAALVLDRQPETQFALVGEGPLRNDVAAEIGRLGLARRVHLLGWRERAARLLATADLATLTSCWEGTPYALLEAMAWARSVVATAVNGCPEIVVEGQTGFLVPPGDVAAWAEAVATLLADGERAGAMGARGRQRVEECFTLERTVAGVEALYRHLLETGGPAK